MINLNSTIHIITLNFNGLKTPVKRQKFSVHKIPTPNYILPTRERQTLNTRHKLKVMD